MNITSIVEGICRVGRIKESPQNHDQLHRIATRIQKIILQSRPKASKDGFYYEVSLENLSLENLRIFVTFQSAIFTGQEPQSEGSFKKMWNGWRIPFEGPPSDVAFLKLRESRQNIQEIEMRQYFLSQNIDDITPRHFEHFKVATNPLSPSEMSILVDCLCNGGDLKSFALQLSSPLTESDIAFILYSMLYSLKVIHGKGLVHRDLKPENFLVEYMERPEGKIVISSLKVGDLGSFCLEGAPNANDSKTAGSPLYFSPESAKQYLIYKESSNLPQADIWAVGISLARLLESRMIRQVFPSKEYKTDKAIFQQLANLAGTDFQAKAKSGSIMETLAASYLQADPEKRPSAKKALEDPLLRKALMASEFFILAVIEGRIPLGRIYEDLLGNGFSDLESEHLTEVKKTYAQAVISNGNRLPAVRTPYSPANPVYGSGMSSPYAITEVRSATDSSPIPALDSRRISSSYRDRFPYPASDSRGSPSSPIPSGSVFHSSGAVQGSPITAIRRNGFRDRTAQGSPVIALRMADSRGRNRLESLLMTSPVLREPPRADPLPDQEEL